MLTQLMVELKFDPVKIQQLSDQLETVNEEQLSMLVQAYKDRVAKRDQFAQQQQKHAEQTMINQALLDKQEAEAFRNHLDREYQQRILQGNMEQNLFRQNLINQQNAQNNRMWGTGGWGTYGPGGYSGGYGGYGYGYNGFVPGYANRVPPNYGYNTPQAPQSYPSWGGNGW